MSHLKRMSRIGPPHRRMICRRCSSPPLHGAVSGFRFWLLAVPSGSVPLLFFRCSRTDSSTDAPATAASTGSGKVLLNLLSVQRMDSTGAESTFDVRCDVVHLSAPSECQGTPCLGWSYPLSPFLLSTLREDGSPQSLHWSEYGFVCRLRQMCCIWRKTNDLDVVLLAQSNYFSAQMAMAFWPIQFLGQSYPLLI